MKRITIALGAVLAWVCGVFGATHEGVQLWENGPLWAKTNVGANSPTETGYYFWWGDTLGYKWQNSKWVASDGSVNNFSFSTANCPTYGKSLAQLQSMGAVGADGNLLPAYDAAAQQWGDDWRVPKASEIENLLALCSWNWTTNSNVTEYNVTGKGLYSGNSIFLPVAGYGGDNLLLALNGLNMVQFRHLKGIKELEMIAREKEQKELNDTFYDERSQFIAVYGRRRIGKTFLVKETFERRTMWLTSVK